MKNQKKLSNIGKIKLNKRIAYPLIIIVLGVFLLPKPAYVTTINDENIIKLTNKEREKHGAEELTANQLLTKAAFDKAWALMESQTFQHTIGEKSFSNWIIESGYEYSFVGENLAIDFVSSEGVIKAWLNSPTHKKNLLNNKFKEIGIAIVEGNFQNQNTILVVQIFGTPLFSNESQNNSLELNQLKNSDNNLSEFDIEDDNLLTNIQENPATSTTLAQDIELQNPKDYLTVLQINPVQAETNSSSNDFNYFNILLYIFFILFLALLSNITYYRFSLLKEEKVNE